MSKVCVVTLSAGHRHRCGVGSCAQARIRHNSEAIRFASLDAADGALGQGEAVFACTGQRNGQITRRLISGVAYRDAQRGHGAVARCLPGKRVSPSSGSG